MTLIPEHLEFGKKPVCATATLTIKILNKCKSSQNLHLLGATTTSIHFEATPFKAKILEPCHNTSFNVVFLPQKIARLDTTILIRTNLGSFRYKVWGYGVESPFKIGPISVTVPPNSPYRHKIDLYNPDNEVLRIREVYTKGGFLKLALIPSPAVSKGLQTWEIAPQQRKEIIFLTFFSSKVGRYQGYIYIETSKSSLVIPIDLSVENERFYPSMNEIDFGTIISGQQISPSSITGINSFSFPVKIVGVHAEPPDQFLAIDARRGLVIPAGGEAEIMVVSYYNPHDIKYITLQGKLVIEVSRTDEQELKDKFYTVKYLGKVIGGSLEYRKASSLFPSFKLPKIPLEYAPYGFELPKIGTQYVRNYIDITSKILIPMMLHSAHTEDPFFIVSNLDELVVLQPTSTYVGLAAEFRGYHGMMYNSKLQLCTNISSSMFLPISSYHGQIYAEEPSTTVMIEHWRNSENAIIDEYVSFLLERFLNKKKDFPTPSSESFVVSTSNLGGKVEFFPEDHVGRMLPFASEEREYFQKVALLPSLKPYFDPNLLPLVVDGKATDDIPGRVSIIDFGVLSVEEVRVRFVFPQQKVSS